jgi:hypothetical protein
MAEEVCDKKFKESQNKNNGLSSPQRRERKSGNRKP